MKLSEAILLGSTVLAPKAGEQYFSETKAGCALGMAAVAKGCTFRPTTQFNQHDRRTLGTEGIWGNWVLALVNRPCGCWRLVAPRRMRIKDIIAHLFDYHVMVKKNWTLEQLVEWVKTVEPAEDASQDRIGRSEATQARFPRQLLIELPMDLEHEEEEEEWQTVRQAFAARNDVRRKHGSARHNRKRVAY
jgi:hypothetical protein